MASVAAVRTMPCQFNRRRRPEELAGIIGDGRAGIVGGDELQPHVRRIRRGREEPREQEARDQELALAHRGVTRMWEEGCQEKKPEQLSCSRQLVQSGANFRFQSDIELAA